MLSCREYEALLDELKALKSFYSSSASVASTPQSEAQLPDHKSRAACRVAEQPKPAYCRRALADHHNLNSKHAQNLAPVLSETPVRPSKAEALKSHPLPLASSVDSPLTSMVNAVLSRQVQEACHCCLWAGQGLIRVCLYAAVLAWRVIVPPAFP